VDIRLPIGPKTGGSSARWPTTPFCSTRTGPGGEFPSALHDCGQRLAERRRHGGWEWDIYGRRFTHSHRISERRIYVLNWTENGVVVSFLANLHFLAQRHSHLGRPLHGESNHLQRHNISVARQRGHDDGAGTYTAGNSRTVTATPKSGYTFVNWTETGSWSVPRQLTPSPRP